MFKASRSRPARVVCTRTMLILGCVGLAGCGGGMWPFSMGNPYGSSGATTGTTVGSSGRTTGGASTGTTGGFVDPCTETQARKTVRISMRNQSLDYIHYFLVLIAFVNGTDYPDGGVCAADIPFYMAFGYQQVPAGQSLPFGDYCLKGPALYYFHKGGQFQGVSGAGGAGLASAIAPAQGSTPTYDTFFTSAGVPVPVPDLILFHNPGTTTEGQKLKVSVNFPNPCADQVVATSADPYCQQDAFYYVDENDRITGSTALGAGSGRRVPAEIQGTGCSCSGANVAMQALAVSGTIASQAQCFQFLRGGRIDYVFVRDDVDPPYPQLLWRVTDANGAQVHTYDPRSLIR